MMGAVKFSLAVLLLAVLGADGHYRNYMNKYNRYRGNNYYSRGSYYTRGRPYGYRSAYYRGGNFINDINERSLVVPLDDVLDDLQLLGARPDVIRNIKHELYIGGYKMDPYLHNTLKRHGFHYTGMNGLGATGATQQEVNNIFNSLGLGGVPGSTLGTMGTMGTTYGGTGLTGAIGSPGTLGTLGVSSVQNPIPGLGGQDDLFDDYSSGLLGLMTENGSDSSAILKD